MITFHQNKLHLSQIQKTLGYFIIMTLYHTRQSLVYSQPHKRYLHLSKEISKMLSVSKLSLNICTTSDYSGAIASKIISQSVASKFDHWVPYNFRMCVIKAGNILWYLLFGFCWINFSLTFYLSLYIFLCQSVCFFVSLLVSIYLFIYIYFSISFYLSLFSSIYLSILM